MLTIQALKAQAKRLRAHLETQNVHLSHSQALEAVAVAQGFRDWRTASGMLPSEEPGAPVATAESLEAVQRRPSEKTSRALAQAKQQREMHAVAESLVDDNLEAPMLDHLLRQIDDIERMGQPGIVDSARQMHIALEARSLPEALAYKVGIYLFWLPGFRYGRHDDAEALHQQLLALRSRDD